MKNHFKRTAIRFLLLFLVLILGQGLFARDIDKAPKWNLGIGFAPNFLSGTMVSDVSNTLTPTPSGLQYVFFLLHAAFFPFKNFGLESYLNFGNISAVSGNQGTKPLQVIDTGYFLIGPIARLIIPISDNLNVDANLSGGLAFGSMSWDSAYTSLLPSGITLASLQPHTGFYGKGGILVSSKLFYCSLSILYQDLSVGLSNSNDFSATSWGVPFEVGVNF